MHLKGLPPERNPDQVDACYAECGGQMLHPSSFGRVDGIDRVALAGRGANLDGNASPPIEGEQIEFTTRNFDVAVDDRQALVGEPPRRDSFPCRTDLGTAPTQSLSSVFSSFSTLTSRKVSTCTFSRKRAGRNMSQTQASVMVTSK